MSIPDRMKALDERFARLVRREKILVAAAAIVGVGLLGNTLLVDPQAVAVKATKKGLDQANGDAAILSAQLASLRDQLKADPDAARKAELATLRTKVDSVSEQIAARQSALVPPDRMNVLLETLLKRHPALRLVSLKSIAPVSMLPPLKESGEGKAGQREFDLYRHGVEVRIEGSYADLYAYLLGVEQHDQKMLWSEVRLQVDEYPRAQLVVVVHTLSADRAWLRI